MAINAVLILLILALDFWALRRLYRSSLATRGQKIIQGAIVLAVPIVGAPLIAIFHKPGKDPDRGDFPPDPGINPTIFGGGPRL
jgi:hypothetical protein